MRRLLPLMKRRKHAGTSNYGGKKANRANAIMKRRGHAGPMCL